MPFPKLTPSEREQIDALWRMTNDQRVAAMRRRELTLAQLLAWTRRCPFDVPQLGGEFEWITYTTPEWLEDGTSQPARYGQRPQPALAEAELAATSRDTARQLCRHHSRPVAALKP